MKARFLPTFWLSVCGLALASYAADPVVTLEQLPPVVIKTVPESGAVDVSPGWLEVRVTFNKRMRAGVRSFYCCSEPFGRDAIAPNDGFEAGERTYVTKVKVQPNRFYAFWANSPTHNGFQDTHGNRALPYLIVFKTGSK